MRRIHPRVGEEMFHIEAGWVTVAAVRHWPVTYCECWNEQGKRFSAVLSALYRDSSLFGDRELD